MWRQSTLAASFRFSRNSWSSGCLRRTFTLQPPVCVSVELPPQPVIRVDLAYTPASGCLVAESVEVAASRCAAFLARIRRSRLGVSPDFINSVISSSRVLLSVFVSNRVISSDTHHSAAYFLVLTVVLVVATALRIRGVARRSGQCTRFPVRTGPLTPDYGSSEMRTDTLVQSISGE